MTTYPNPPITEALIDIRVTPREDIATLDIGGLHHYIESDYPAKKEQRRFENTVVAKSGEEPIVSSVDKGIVGFLFYSSDEKEIVQFRKDGFTFSRLKPYEKWEKIFDEAKRLWKIYNEYLRPAQVTRVAVRYINKIDIPLLIFDMDDYFTTTPKMPDDFQQPIEDFSSKVTILFPKTETKAIVSMSPFRTKNTSNISILLDIDVFKVAMLEPDDPEIWNILLNHRQIKNDIFEMSIKDLTREFFK